MRLQRLRWGVIVTGIIFCFNLTQIKIVSADKKNFPVPENLKPNIEFWKNVFTLYNKNQVIIHDAENLDIVYEIFNAKEFFGNGEYSEKAKWQEVEKAKKKYHKILIKLAKKKEIQPDSLEAEDRFIYNLFKPNCTAETFLRASKNLRGQQGLREYFREGIIRSGKYTHQIKQIFNKYNLPQELIALPHVESSFNYKAYSKHGAAGMWQFTRRTGRRFLKINYTVDERFDPIKSTEAAAKLFKYNYEQLGSWPLAITAYNHGVYGMLRAVSRLKTKDLGKIVDNYKSRSFKFASRNFYAEFLAAVEVEENYKIYFGELVFAQPKKYLSFNVPNYVKISTLTKRLGVTIEDIKEYNSSLRRSVLLSKRRLPKGFTLKIPYRKNFNPAVAYAQIPVNKKFQSQISTNWYQVQSGDNLYEIAGFFKTTITELIAINEINNPDQIHVGQYIQVKPENEIAGVQTNQNTLAQNKNRTTKEKNAVAVEQISGPHVTDNALEADNLSKATNKTIIRADETLGNFADWLKIPTHELRTINGINFGEEIHVNQEIEITFRNVDENQFKQKRVEFHQAIEEDFFTNFKINDIKIHTVQKGENILNLCDEVYRVPLWLVQKYNPGKKLLNLKTGDLILFPDIGNNPTDAAG
ncbi:transglycosylase SLT domain-containing protein [candidate division KSB1 bacterium]|nr:transglycosylase SLT domain-containing protein [candidate division KSB1 bacterium]